MIRIFRIGITLALVIGTSCNSDILDYDDPNSISLDSYFKTPEQVQEGAIAIYSSFFHNSAISWQLPEMFDGLANEFEARPPSANESEIQALLHYQHNNTTMVITSFWRLLYRMILRSNLVIYKAGQYTETNGSNEVVSRAMGDAYFLRAWAYSQLAFHWGSVPLRVLYSENDDGNAPRAPSKEIWEQAESDFKRAQILLPLSWADGFVGRATSGAATALLGKLHLYNERFAEAEMEFAKLDGHYALLPADQWDDNFGEERENNIESVFEIQCANLPGTNPISAMFRDPEELGSPGRQNGHAQLYSWTDWSNWAFQRRRVNDFIYSDESGNTYHDPRARLTFYGGIGDSTWCDQCPGGARAFNFDDLYYWYRKSTNKENKPAENGAYSGNNVRLVRYADVLLMRAECYIKQGNVAEGLKFINQVRARIGAFQYSSSYTSSEAFELLKRERQVEFMGEQVRYSDLKRWGILKETMNIETSAMFGTMNVLDKHNLFPIPLLEIETNRSFGIVKDNWN